MGLRPPALGGDIPVDPDAPQARQWLLDELAKAEYRSAQPTWFDLLSAAVRDWFTSLQFGGIDGPPQLGALVVVILVALALVAAFLVFGLPRLNRRSSLTGGLFGDDDSRDAATLRRAAETAAARGDYSTAITEMFRAVARGLAERTVLVTTPGTTAHDFASRAGAAFPALEGALVTAAADFDDVRYLGRTGTEAAYDRLAALERDLRAARARLEPVGA